MHKPQVLKRTFQKKSTYGELENNFYKGKSGDDKIRKNNAELYLKKAKAENNVDQIAEAYVLLHFDKPLPVALKYLDSLQKITKNSTNL